ncbi:MAG: winged helix-turn-helix domain-containing protein [Anaerolineaceae bacterium]|nr:winged helix-turn-helix domain-containing protein [Anaerolineaceae bacterium]
MSEKRVPTLTDPTGRTHNLAGATTMIGRAVENEIVVSSQRISREHACIRREGWRVILEDVGSTNGTFLNDQRILEPVQLRDGDHIKVGDVLFVFHDPEVTYQDTVLPELEMDIPAGIVRINRQPVDLAPKEFELLAYLFSQPNLVCSKDAIGTAVWPEYQGGVFDYQIENLVRRLRLKLESDPQNPQLLLTVRGRGYKLVL